MRITASTLVAAALLACGVCASPAKASFLDDQFVYVQESLNDGPGNGTSTLVGPDFEFFGTNLYLDISDDSLELHFIQGYSYTDKYPKLNGLTLFFPSFSALSGIGSATLTSSTL